MNIKEYISSGIIELYVMGLCSPEEEQELEQLRVQYPELQTAILQYEKDMEEKMLQQGILPSAAADEAILHRLESLSAPVVTMHNNITRVRKINWIRAIAASVAILLGISAYFNYTLYQKTKNNKP
ncbi:MAG: hypothetical protein IPG86_10845 [Chitinophagaceae bacterium]|nr:hypothetical protein [Chitinophagaceae bacterium]